MRYLFIISLVISNLLPGQSRLEEATRALQLAEYEKAYVLFEEQARIQLSIKPLDYVVCNLRMSECKILIGEPDAGRQLAENAEAYILNNFPTDKILIGEALTLQGKAYLNLGRNDMAMELLKKAEGYFTKEHTLEKAACLNDLGIAYLNNYNLELARQYLEISLSIRQNKLKATDPLIGDSFNNLGLTYFESDPLQSLIFYTRAYRIYEQSLGADHPKTAQVLNNLAMVQAAQGNYDDAFEELAKVQSIWERRYTGDHPRKAFTLLTKGRFQLQQEKYGESLLSLASALKMYLNLFGPRHPEVANTYFLMGEVYTKQQQYRDALDHYQRSIFSNTLDQDFLTTYDLPVLRDYFNADILLSSLQAKAVALERLHYEKTLNVKELTSAIATYEICDDLISIIRQVRQNERDKIRLGEIAKDVYESGMRLSLTLSEESFKRKYYLSKAFQFAERSKSAVLLEAINETKAKSFAGIPQHLINLEDSLKAEIAFFEQQLAIGEDQERFKQLLFAYQSAYQKYILKLETEYPEYFNLKYNSRVASALDVQKRLGEGTTLLSYFIGKEFVYAFEVNTKSVKAHRIPKKEDFDKLAPGMRNAIRYQVEDRLIEVSKKLYGQVIPKKLAGSPTTLVILPDGVLGIVPFEALVNPESSGNTYSTVEFLIKKYQVAYDYSATLFVNRSESKKELEESILLCAPLSFEKNEVRMVNLPASESEVKEIKLLFGSNGRADLKTKSEASEALLKSDQLKQYKYVHFATHGLVDEGKPELSRIFLAPDQEEDGSLYAGEIYNLKINADLVTLSACETGLGKIAKGEGIVGLSRALQYAGANNLIVTLWQVADASTALLMVKFYDVHLHSNSPKGYHQALRQAKLHLMQMPEYQSPYFWAPFVLIGY
jgi:CHAT domain-containing protein/Flp pilus assembly protein TadD